MICSYNTLEPTHYCIPNTGLFADPSLKFSAAGISNGLQASTAGIKRDTMYIGLTSAA